MRYLKCTVWTVARTSLGTAVLLRTDEENRSFPIYLTNAEALRLLSALEGPVKEDLLTLFLKREKLLKDKNTPSIYLKDQDKNLSPELRIGRRKYPLSGPEAIELSIRGSYALKIEKGLYLRGAIRVNLLQKEDSLRLKRLEKQLREAIEMEYYEDAAKIRDEIVKLNPPKGRTGE